MTFYKTIVCLANSRKEGGRCVAGKEIVNNQLTHNWIRPVSGGGNKGELSKEESLLTVRSIFPKLPKWLNTLIGLFLKRQSSPQLLDIITIPLLEHQLHTYQSENYLIDNRRHWIKEQFRQSTQLSQWCDRVPSLWINGYHSYNGFNDRIPVNIVEKSINTSLLLIKPDTISIKVASEFNKVKVRAEFTFNGQKYRIVVTDPTIESFYKTKSIGDYPLLEETYLCISLGEPFNGYCYKLVASVIFLNKLL